MLKSMMILLTIVIPCVGRMNAQGEDLIPVVTVTKSTCFTNSLELERIYWNPEIPESIIIVSHLGTTEKKKFGARRLHIASTFLSLDRNKSDARSKLSVVAAEGSKATGMGYVDFFVNGRLELRIVLSRNSDLLVSPCVTEPEDIPCGSFQEKLFYPCKARR